MTYPLPRPSDYVPTEDESVDIKSDLDTASALERSAIAASYPLEYDEWHEERERGDR